MEHFGSEGIKSICVITDTFVPHHSKTSHIQNKLFLSGGAEKDVAYMVQMLQKSKFRTSVVCLNCDMGKYAKDPGYVLRIGDYAPYTFEKNIIKNGLRFLICETINPIILCQLLLFFRRWKPDAIILGETHQMGLALHIASRILRIPLYLRYDWICPSLPEENPCSYLHRVSHCGECLEKKNALELSLWSKKIFSLVASFVYILKLNFWRKCTRALAINDFYSKVYYKGYGMPPRKILVVPPYRQLPRVPLQNDTFKNLIKDEAFKILFVGRLSKEKGLQILLEAFERIVCHANVKLIIAGDGPQRSDIEGFLERYPNRILWLGWLEDIELSQVYQVADIVVIPSIVHEGHPLVAVEAIDYGKPIIGFGLGGLREILNAYSKGIIVEEISSKELTKVILQLYEISRRRPISGMW
jgi:glycosyltransferase involved in cell wall biosynthesis